MEKIERHTLKDWRLLRHMTLAELSELCGISSNSLMAWEKKPSMMKLENVKIVADSLGVTLDEVILLP